jgi:hypothetical protein
VAALTLVGEEVTVLGEGVLDQLGVFDNPWHDQMLRSPTAPEHLMMRLGRFSLF